MKLRAPPGRDPDAMARKVIGDSREAEMFLALADARDRGIRFYVNATDQLGYRCPKGVMTKEMLERLRKVGKRLVALLKQQAAVYAPRDELQ